MISPFIFSRSVMGLVKTQKWSEQENQNFPFKPQESVMGLVERQEAPRKGE